ncbi:adenine deaminase [Clostridium grantii]|uniref:Adenine deaminase n=1 Tax=Clostridium grantii DSM 8605 TaxID=1121316 RepID=A0A1M5QXK5_9CLOT|nr:adenine deaminase [Clostridium grantii]SHH18865.1 Adenine deaminase [Clostridium grantii DSM 8605]
MKVSKTKNLIEVATGRKKADLVIENCNVVNVFSQEIIYGKLAISDGIFVGIGDYEGVNTMDGEGKYIVPGLIDSHVHIESSMGSPYQFARAVLPRGTTTVISDCHEIANVKGLEGIKYMIESSENLPLDVYIMLPSCVPATKFETSGAVLEAEDLEELIKHDRVLGLGELMNYQGVVFTDEGIIKKLELTDKYHKVVDGHGPVIKEKELNAYSLAGVKTDHECMNHKEVLDRLRNGIYIAVREGSAAKNLLDIVGTVNSFNERRFTFCTDDRHPKDIIQEGHIDNNIRIAIRGGVSPITAIRMATLNSAECYGLKNLGAIAPGYIADFIIVDNLTDFNVLKTFKEGKQIKEDWYKYIKEDKNLLKVVSNSVNIKEFTKDDLKIKLKSDFAKVIKIVDHSLFTENVTRKVMRDEDGFYVNSETQDILPIYVIERHKGTGNIGKGLIEGYGLKNGAIASTIAHDSHNLVIIGDNPSDVKLAADKIIEIGGGLVIVKDGKVRGCLPLDIAGIMSSEDLEIVSKGHEELNKIATDELKINVNINAFMTLAFMALPVIPKLKITDQGLFDVVKFEHTDL